MNLQADMSCDKHKLKINYSAANGRRSQRQAAPPSPIAHIFSQNSSQSGVVGSTVGATVSVGEVAVIVVVGVDCEVAVWAVVGAEVRADDGFVAVVFTGVENSVVLFVGIGVVVAEVDDGTGVGAIVEDAALDDDATVVELAGKCV